MNRKRQKPVATGNSRQEGGEIHAYLAPKRERTPLAAWKIVVPILVVLLLLHFRLWYAEEEWLLRTALSGTSYQTLSGRCALLLALLGMGGWMLYARTHCPREKGERLAVWLLIHFCRGCYWSAGAMILCTNLLVVFLFWLNQCFLSAPVTHTYYILDMELHDRTRRSMPGRYSGTVFLNNFSYGEVLVTDSLGIRHLYLSLPNTVRLSSLRGCVLQVEASRGCLGWERVHRITPLLRAVPDSSGLHSSSPYPASAAGADTSFPASDSSERASPDSLTTKKLPAFIYTRRDIRIFALLRGIDLKDTSRVCVQRLRMGADSLPVWQLGVLRADKEGRMRRIRIHGQTEEVLSDTLLSAVACHRH